MFLQELGDEMFVIISNTVQSKINLFIKFILDDHYQLEFVTIIAQKSTAVYHLHQYKTRDGTVDYYKLSQVTK